MNPSVGAADAENYTNNMNLNTAGEEEKENMESKQDLRAIKECVAPRIKRARDWLLSKTAGRTHRQKERANRAKGKITRQTSARALCVHDSFLSPR